MELVKVENGQLQVAQEIISEIVEFEKTKKEFEKKQNEFKELLIKAMEENNIKQFKSESDGLTITYVAPTTRIGVDNKKLQEEYEDIYLQCLKETPIKASIRIKVDEI